MDELWLHRVGCSSWPGDALDVAPSLWSRGTYVSRRCRRALEELTDEEAAECYDPADHLVGLVAANLWRQDVRTTPTASQGCLTR